MSRLETTVWGGGRGWFSRTPCLTGSGSNKKRQRNSWQRLRSHFVPPSPPPPKTYTPANRQITELIVADLMFTLNFTFTRRLLPRSIPVKLKSSSVKQKYRTGRMACVESSQDFLWYIYINLEKKEFIDLRFNLHRFHPIFFRIC